MLNQNNIKDIIPHKYPFLFLNQASIHRLYAKATYLITGKEYFLKGHFKNNPIFPASIMLEALGQLAVLFLLQSYHLFKKKNVKINKKQIMFVSSDRISCHKICKPNDKLKMYIFFKSLHIPLIKFNGFIKKNYKNNKIVLVDNLTLAFNILKN